MAKLTFGTIDDYSYRNLKDRSRPELVKEYNRLSKVADNRLERLKASEYADDISARTDYRIDPNTANKSTLAKALHNVAGVASYDIFTITGQKEKRSKWESRMVDLVAGAPFSAEQLKDLTPEQRKAYREQYKEMMKNRKAAREFIHSNYHKLLQLFKEARQTMGEKAFASGQVIQWISDQLTQGLTGEKTLEGLKRSFSRWMNRNKPSQIREPKRTREAKKAAAMAEKKLKKAEKKEAQRAGKGKPKQGKQRTRAIERAKRKSRKGKKG